MKNVALVRMPWGSLGRPSPAIGILRAVLNSAKISSQVFYPDFWCAHAIGNDFYRAVASGEHWPLLPEWLFSKAAFPGEFTEPTAGVIEKWDAELRRSNRVMLRNWKPELIRFRENIAQLVAKRLARECATADVVAFTCSINQLVPALAAARAVKARNPGIKVLLGGTQVEGKMGDETLRLAPWVDATYKGEAEVGLLETLEWLFGNATAPPSEFVSYRTADSEAKFAPGVALLDDMDQSPTPDYQPYFEQLSTDEALELRVMCEAVPFVSSRGCWWGQKKHCTFCGLNGNGMAFRHKSADLIVEEILSLVRDYQCLTLVAMDNIIPQSYFKDVLPRLRDSGLDLDIRYETKSNLSRQQVELYRDAGVRLIQPGIESLSDHTLRLMRKGVTGLRNIYTLKLAAQYDLQVQWNLLVGFPGETLGDFEDQASLIPRLHHLMPPVGTAWIRLERFSPFHFEPEKLGVRSVKPLASYRDVFPSAGVDFSNLAFYFSFEKEHKSDVTEASQAALVTATTVWQRRWHKRGTPPTLHFYRGGSFVEVRDRRHRKGETIHRLTNLEADLLLACEDIVSRKALYGRFGDAEAVDSVIDALDELKLIAIDENHVLGLPIPAPKGMSMNRFPRASHIGDREQPAKKENLKNVPATPSGAKTQSRAQ